MAGDCEYRWVGQAYDPVLGTVHINLCWCDGGDEAAGYGHRGGEQSHLLAGEEELLCVGLATTGKEDSNEGREEKDGDEDDILLPTKL